MTADKAPIEVDEGNLKFVYFFQWASTGLFLIFITTQLIDILPFLPTNPEWQVGFINRLISNGMIALTGFLLAHLAFLVSPFNPKLKSHFYNLRKWAIAAAIGYILLIPLQGFATWRAFSIIKTSQQTQLQEANKRFAPLKKAINEATSIKDLEDRLKKLNLRTDLQQANSTGTLQETKKTLLLNLERAEIRVNDQFSGTKPQQIWSAAQAGVRTVAYSLGLALAFAAGAQASESSDTLLESFSNRFGSLIPRRRSRHRLQPPI